MSTTIDGVRFNALRNALYHTSRRLTCERLDRWFSFLVIALGTGAVADVTGWVEIPASVVGAVVAIVGALQLAFGFGRNARDHQVFQRQYYDILAEIEETTDADTARVAAWSGRMIRIAGEEPPIMRAVDARAYNDAVDALEWSRDQRLIVPFWHRVFAQVVAFQGHAYPKACETIVADAP